MPSVPPKPSHPPAAPAAPAAPVPTTGEAWLPEPGREPRSEFDFSLAAPVRPAGHADVPGPRPLGARIRGRAAAAAACAVLGIGLIGGAAAGSWLQDGGRDEPGGAYSRASELWHNVPVDQLFPPTVEGEGAGPGGADRTWTRIAVAPDTGCSGAFDPLLSRALAPVGCLRLLRASYTDTTSSHVLTIGLLFTKGDESQMRSLSTRFRVEGLDRRRDLMPRTYAAAGTLAEGFGEAQRASWAISVLTDAPVVVYAVSGFADHRSVTEPEPAADAMKNGATSDIAQSGLGHEAQGLADRIERSLRKKIDPPTEKRS
ncbi:hypothetical protein [Streptomyces cavernae]|uniref:hypothetical protein n=1 Tax=Streptomyces cavernae TaxID=2259034 RepID=UPI0030B83243